MHKDRVRPDKGNPQKLLCLPLGKLFYFTPATALCFNQKCSVYHTLEPSRPPMRPDQAQKHPTMPYFLAKNCFCALR